MRQKEETNFRRDKVTPFLKSLKKTAYFPIQQLAILGDADFILCSAGHFIWLELKRDGDEPRPLQKYKAFWVEQCHGTVIIACPSNWAKVQKQILRIDGKKK